MPGADVLFDSNVLLYALSDAPAERAKRERAVDLIATEDFTQSEDLAHGKDYDGITVINPFRDLV